MFGELLIPALVFVGLGVAMGVLLAIATKAFKVEVDEKAEQITECLPGANCGGCGYTGCAALAVAISTGDAKVSSCTVGGAEVADKIAEIMGVESAPAEKMRAHVMCSGTCDAAKKKYIYEGYPDCVSAAAAGGGEKMCPTGCIGLGSCEMHCPFDAIKVENGVAVVLDDKCRGCGVCIAHCPQNVIKLVPSSSKYYVTCSSKDTGKAVRTYCDSGCIGCKICEKQCEAGAITVTNALAVIDYSKCTSCGKCAEKCPRKIIKKR